MTTPIERVKEIALDLIGCCSGSRPNLEEELRELGVGTDKEASEAFDEVCFECDSYGWYASADELNTETGESLCQDCSECEEEDRETEDGDDD